MKYLLILLFSINLAYSATIKQRWNALKDQGHTFQILHHNIPNKALWFKNLLAKPLAYQNTKMTELEAKDAELEPSRAQLRQREQKWKETKQRIRDLDILTISDPILKDVIIYLKGRR